ncbi:hypothetical protein BH09PSE6_BH09PSE6_31610 [soil metagenome]
MKSQVVRPVSRAAAFMLGSALLCVASIAQADGVYKCDRGNGLVEYGNGATLPSGCKYVDITTAPVVTVPAPKSQQITKGSAPRPADFPRVDAAAQRTRDDDRRRVLESELKVQQDKLGDLKREYNGGEPERQGNERNYQKYLDRTAQLKEDIARGESNVASIQRELSNLRDASN